MKLGLIGVGLIGASAALAWRRAGAVGEAIGYDVDPRAGRAACDIGAVDRMVASPGKRAGDLAGALAGADLILIATPAGAVAEVLRQVAASLGPHTLVSDVCSTKVGVIDAARAGLRAAFGAFVPAHPIAGSERSGAAAADPDLFRGRLVVTTPLADTRPEALERVEALWRAAGARIERMTPQRHDHVFAAVSHLPHLLAYALVATIAEASDAADTLRFAGSGFRDLTRIAASSPALWRDIACANRAPLGAELRRLRATLERLQGALDGGDGAALEALFELAARTRRTLGAADLPAPAAAGGVHGDHADHGDRGDHGV